jgi:hypothetical protein
MQKSVGAHKGGRLNLGEVQRSFYVPMIQEDITVSVCAISHQYTSTTTIFVEDFKCQLVYTLTVICSNR